MEMNIFDPNVRENIENLIDGDISSGIVVASELSGAISTEVSNRNVAINSAISTEVVNRDLAISTEVSLRDLAIESAVSTAMSVHIATEHGT
jgi:hypothetical protein